MAEPFKHLARQLTQKHDLVLLNSSKNDSCYLIPKLSPLSHQSEATRINSISNSITEPLNSESSPKISESRPKISELTPKISESSLGSTPKSLESSPKSLELRLESKPEIIPSFSHSETNLVIPFPRFDSSQKKVYFTSTECGLIKITCECYPHGHIVEQ